MQSDKKVVSKLVTFVSGIRDNYTLHPDLHEKKGFRDFVEHIFQWRGRRFTDAWIFRAIDPKTGEVDWSADGVWQRIPEDVVGEGPAKWAKTIKYVDGTVTALGEDTRVAMARQIDQNWDDANAQYDHPTMKKMPMRCWFQDLKTHLKKLFEAGVEAEQTAFVISLVAHTKHAAAAHFLEVDAATIAAASAAVSKKKGPPCSKANASGGAAAASAFTPKAAGPVLVA